ncbi:MAG: DUF2723 domain-containing protein [Candidatus Promineofilum sp.]|nr:DUF2723 domain-containing protein [Promineifilum sp.]
MGGFAPHLTDANDRTWRPWLDPAAVAVCWFIAGLALSRLLFEAAFPAWLLLGQPSGAMGLAAVVAVGGAAGAIVWRDKGLSARLPLAVLFLPLLLNIVWLVDPTVDPARGRFLFGAGLWLSAALLVWATLGDEDRRWGQLGPLLVAAGLLPLYLATMSHAVGTADTFEFQVVAPQLGIAHPTGYPLYLLLGKLFSLLPAGTVAWRLNLASAVYGVLAAAVVFRLGLELWRRPLPALAAAVVLGLTPVYWGQAIIAEVYTLHALIVAVALWLVVQLTMDGGPQTPIHESVAADDPVPEGAIRRQWSVNSHPAPSRKKMVALAFVLGLGLTNHLTTVFLLPPATLAVLINLWPTLARRSSGVSRRRSLIPLLLQLLIAFAVPLLLYLYLPLRWAAVNGEAMGFGRFVEWVVGGRFQGALQWGAWLRDPTRRQIVGRLLLDTWGWFYGLTAAVGLVWLFARQWRTALALLLTAAGFTFYTLNYYVPDLAVFLIPTHVVVAIWIGAGMAALAGLLATEFFPKYLIAKPLLFMAVLLLAVLQAGNRWASIDQSGRDGGETWGRGVLTRPLARGAAVLADSEKIAPLYYLQQNEGLRPDLDIMVLPDEAAYHAELDARLAAGQAVYLARYLPGLAGVYYLRSAGPLVEVSREPLAELPAAATAAGEAVGALRLLGYAVEPVSPVDGNAAGLTLYWTRSQPLDDGQRAPVLYLRWAGGEPVIVGRHPVSDTYPVNAWRKDEIVADFHLLPLPDGGCGEPACDLEIQVAAAPRFTPAAELQWQPVATVPVSPRPGPAGQPRRALFGGFALDGVDFPGSARPGTRLPLRYSGYGDGDGLSFLLAPPHAVSSLIIPTDRPPDLRVETAQSLVFAGPIEPAAEAGPNVLIAYAAGEASAVCGWLRRPTTGCIVAEIIISGAALPEGATNFDDKIALLDVTVETAGLTPGGQLLVTLTWRALTKMSEDYTVFVQVLDAADRIVGQVDAWPVQGTRPTGDWRPGEDIVDPYVVQLSPDMQPGDYRVIVGLYLLATGQRLPVIDDAGHAVDDRVVISVILD